MASNLPFDTANFNLTNFANIYPDVMDSTPSYVTYQYKDANGVVQTKSIVNRGQFKQDLWDDVGGALGQFDRTLYVDATNGDDNNDGSLNNPFKTLKKAVDSIPVSGAGVIYLKTDVTVSDSSVAIKNKTIIFRSYDEANNEFTITLTHHELGDYVYLYSFILYYGVANISFRNVNINVDDYAGTLTLHSQCAVFGFVSDGFPTSYNVSCYSNSIELKKAKLIASPHSSKGSGGYINLSTYNTTITTNSENYVISACATTVSLQTANTTIDDSAYWIECIIKDADSGNPINVLSNINFSD